MPVVADESKSKHQINNFVYDGTRPDIAIASPDTTVSLAEESI
jgi:hypothetical protein